MNRPNHIELVKYERLPSTDAPLFTLDAWGSALVPSRQMCARGDGPTSAMERCSMESTAEESHH